MPYWLIRIIDRIEDPFRKRENADLADTLARAQEQLRTAESGRCPARFDGRQCKLPAGHTSHLIGDQP